MTPATRELVVALTVHVGPFRAAMARLAQAANRAVVAFRALPPHVQADALRRARKARTRRLRYSLPAHRR